MAKDPWSGRDSNGPPDLDEVLRKFQQKLSAMFGGNGNSGGTGGRGNSNNSASFDKGTGGISLGFMLIIGVILYICSGFYQVRNYEQGMVTRLGKYNRSVMAGLHWLPTFIEKITKVNTEELMSSKHGDLMLTKDENIIYAEIQVQYRKNEPLDYLYKMRDPDQALEEAANSALRQVVGESMADDVLTDKKEQIAGLIQNRLIETLNAYKAGFYIAEVIFKDSKPPEQVKDAFDDVTKSREDKERLSLQADAYANKVIPEAEGAARRMILEAEAYKQEVIYAAEGEAKRFELMLPEYKKAPKLTKVRMYIDTMEKILSNSSKMLIDTNAGNNLVYLPLDKLMGQVGTKGAVNE